MNQQSSRSFERIATLLLVCIVLSIDVPPWVLFAVPDKTALLPIVLSETTSDPVVTFSIKGGRRKHYILGHFPESPKVIVLVLLTFEDFSSLV